VIIRRILRFHTIKIKIKKEITPMDTSDKRYQALLEELRNCILSENLEISRAEQNLFNYRYETHINFDGTLIPVEITLHTLDETISICFQHNVVPEDRFDEILHLVNYFNTGVRLQHFAVCHNITEDVDVVLMWTGFPVTDSPFDKKLFSKVLAYAIACCELFCPLITEVIESGNVGKVISDFEKVMKTRP
jgi:hypothetical protein